MATGIATSASAASRGQAGRRRRRINWLPLVFLSPTLALAAVVIVFPFVRAVWFSFNETSFLGGVLGFVGLDNYRQIVDDPNFGLYARNSLIWVGGGVGLQLVFGCLGALLLDRRFRLRGVVRGLAMIPWATPSVLVALIWLWMLEPNHGVINAILLRVGLVDHPVAWLSTEGTALPTLVVVDAWQGVPFFAVMILAALQSVPSELKEAARTDGCGAPRVFRHVVFPHILPTILITLTLRIMWTANYIDLPYVLTGGGPARASTTIPLQSYLTAYKGGDFGQGAAYAMIQAVILAVCIAVYLRLTRAQEADR